MTENRYLIYWQRINVGLILLILFSTPLIMDWWGWNIFELSKAAVFCWLVEILLVSWLAKALVVGKIKNPLPAAGWLLLFIYLASQLLALVFSLSSTDSLVGAYWRQQGFVLLVHLVIFFIICLDLLPQLKIKYWLATISASLVFVLVYAWLQLSGVDVVNWQEPPYLMLRVFSSLGQPNFLAALLILLWPLTLWWRPRAFLAKFGLGLWLAAQAIILFFTGSRLALVVVIMQILALGFYWLWRQGRQRLVKIAAAIFCLVVIIYLIFGIINFNRPVALNQAAPNFWSNLLQRWQALGYWQYGSLGTRLGLWQQGFKILPKLPLWGFGPEAQGFALSSFYTPQAALSENINAIPDRLHNIFLDTLVTVGFFGLVAWLAWLGWVGKRGFDNLATPADQSTRRCLGLVWFGVLGVLLFNQFNFFDVVGLVYWWWFLAVVMVYTAEPSLKEQQFKIRPVLKILVIVLLVVFLWPATKFYLDRLVADRYFAAAQRLAGEQNYQRWLKVFQFNNSEWFYQQNFAQSVINYFQTLPVSPLKQQGLALAEKFLQEIDNLPYNIDANLALAAAKVLQSEKKTASELVAIEQLYQRIAKLSPQQARIYAQWGKAYYFWSQYDLALAKLLQAIALYPALDDWRLNSPHRRLIAEEMSQTYEDLGQVYFSQKNYTAASAAYLTAYHLSTRLELIKKLVDTYYQSGQQRLAVQEVLHLITLQPKNTQWYSLAAMLYNELGERDRAGEYLRKYQELTNSIPK